MIAPVVADAPPAAARPVLSAPAPYQVSFGRVVARLPDGTVFASVLVDGRVVATRAAPPGRFALTVPLPPREATVRVVTTDWLGRRRRSAPVRHVIGLPPAAAPRRAGSVRDAALSRRVTRLARAFPGVAAVYVRDLRTGLGAAWNARARFPAASTLKVAIALATLRALRSPPAPGSALAGELNAMIVGSDNRAANSLLVQLGGSTSGGSARVDSLLRSLGLLDTEMYGGYETDDPAEREIPVTLDEQPQFGVGKYTTARDLAVLFTDVYLAAGGRGPLLRRLRGEVTPAEARYLLYLLALVEDRDKLARFLPVGAVVAHKAGWISAARHDGGLVFWPGGAFVATVMTWNAGGVGTPSDVLAGRVAAAALARYQRADG